MSDDDALPRIYQIHLPGYEGPLDLLLHLIEKRQMEITAISLVAVTDQFIEYLRTWADPPMAYLAGFVAMASRLLLIKSRSLLPRSPMPEDEAAVAEAMEDAEAIRRNLLEYKLAKEIAAALRQRDAAGLRSFARQTPPQDVEATITLGPPKLLGSTPGALATAFRRALQASQDREPAELPLPVVTVAEKIAEIEARLAESADLPLADLLAGITRRIIIVVTFLAVLELWHQGRIGVRQDDLFDVIILTRHASPEHTTPGSTNPQADGEY